MRAEELRIWRLPTSELAKHERKCPTCGAYIVVIEGCFSEHTDRRERMPGKPPRCLGVGMAA